MRVHYNLAPQQSAQFSMAAISFVIACKELKIVQIVQINQPFQLSHLLWVKSYANEQKCRH